MADANAISDRIRKVTQHCYAKDRDNLTVNIVRNIVELELGLKQGTLRSEAWKERSKEEVLGEVVCTLFLILLLTLATFTTLALKLGLRLAAPTHICRNLSASCTYHRSKMGSKDKKDKS